VIDQDKFSGKLGRAALTAKASKAVDVADATDIADLPIGVFDSGIGGLTVARELARCLPKESIIYLGDSLRCPYGPRPLDEVERFALQISAWLVAQKVKLIVIACNSATAAGLEAVQRSVQVPVIGVIEPGARAAVQATANGKVGVIGTVATIESGAYTSAIRSLDTDITVFSAATPRFVEIVEQGMRLDNSPLEDFMAQTAAIYIRPAFAEIARDYLNPLKRCSIDSLVLGCTHYPLLTPLISSVMGPGITIISSAEQTVLEVANALEQQGHLAPDGHEPLYRFFTTAPDTDDFIRLGSAIFGKPLMSVTTVSLDELIDENR